MNLSVWVARLVTSLPPLLAPCSLPAIDLLYWWFQRRRWALGGCCQGSEVTQVKWSFKDVRHCVTCPPHGGLWLKGQSVFISKIILCSKKKTNPPQPSLRHPYETITANTSSRPLLETEGSDAVRETVVRQESGQGTAAPPPHKQRRETFQCSFFFSKVFLKNNAEIKCRAGKKGWKIQLKKIIHLTWSSTATNSSSRSPLSPLT